MRSDEKRANSRITIRDDVTLLATGVTEGETCTLENISSSGAMFFSSHQLAVGDRAELRVPSLENNPEIIIKVKILRLEAGDYGEQFGYAGLIEDIENA